MNIHFTDAAKQELNGSGTLQQATKMLEEVVGSSAWPPTVEWDREQDPTEKPAYALRLSNWMGSVSAQFSPKELAGGHDLRYRLIRLWSDLLAMGSHKLQRKSMESTDQPEE